MSIKGTLETFNLCELLQMLAFNQKEGTLVLDSEQGARTLYLGKGDLTFLERDQFVTASILRMAKRSKIGTEARLDEALERAREAGRSLLSVLEGMGLLDDETKALWYRDAMVEQLFDGQLTSVAGFEFVEGRALAPDGVEGRPIQPAQPVESMLLDVARMLDHWNTIIEVVPSPHEIYEGTGIGVDLEDEGEIEDDLADVVIPRIDGHRSLEQIADACHTTLFNVMQIAALLVEGGGIRAVPTESLYTRAEDLLARGESAAAVPLLRRALEREDAPLSMHLRLADALEASGHAEEAASALDTYAALADDDDAPQVFESLCRALRMRTGDLATAARVCDYYLRRRPWLQEYRDMATAALRDLIHGATTKGRPLDAAMRLKGYIEVGDAPMDDRLLLADLLAAGGESQQAAAALFEQCLELIEDERRIQARQMLRRVLEHDSGHADARRLLLEMDSARKRTHHRARVFGLVIALLVVAGGAGVAWVGFEETATTEMGDAQSQAEIATTNALDSARDLVAAFEARVEAVRRSAEEDDGLAAAAMELRQAVRDVMSSTSEALAAYLSEVENYTATGNGELHQQKHDALVQRRKQVSNQVDALLAGYVDQAKAAFVAGKKAHADGNFDAARQHLRESRNLAFESTATRNIALQKLEIVDEYHDLVDTVDQAMKKATAAGNFELAFTTGVVGLRAHLDSDLTRKLAFPLRITSTPPGAEVWVDGEDTRARTPCDITYSPFLEKPILKLRLPGYRPVNHRLPAFNEIRRGFEPRPSFKPALGGKLVPGLRWRIVDPLGPYRALWGTGNVPAVVGGTGRRIYSVAGDTGELTAGSRLAASVDAVRSGGRLPDGLEWAVRGQRTILVRPAEGVPWEASTIGRIEHAPIVVDGILMLVDAVGVVYGFAATDGSERWRLELGAPPTQRTYTSKLGVILGTALGATYRISTDRGEAQPLAPAARGAALALPLGDGALVLGGGEGGLRTVAADGTVKEIGDAQPQVEYRPWVAPEGITWIDADGRVRFCGGAEIAAVTLEGLGTDCEWVCSANGCAYGTTRTGTVRAVRLDEPTRTVFEAPLGARAVSVPLCLENAMYILLADGAVVAVEI